MSGGFITTRAALGSAPRRGSRDAVAWRGRGRWRVGGRRAARAGGHSRAAEAVRSSWSAACWALRGLREPRSAAVPADEAAAAAPAARRRPTPSNAADAWPSIRSSVEVGYALVALVDEKQGGTLLDARPRASAGRSPPRPASSCRRCTSPTTCSSGRATYAILVKGVEVARGELYARPPAGDQPRHGVRRRSTARPTREPAFGLPAWWIATEQRDRVTAAGYTVVDPTTALSTHLSETIRTFLPDLLRRQQTKEMLDRVGADVAAA